MGLVGDRNRSVTAAMVNVRRGGRGGGSDLNQTCLAYLMSGRKR